MPYTMTVTCCHIFGNLKYVTSLLFKQLFIKVVHFTPVDPNNL